MGLVLQTIYHGLQDFEHCKLLVKSVAVSVVNVRKRNVLDLKITLNV